MKRLTQPISACILLAAASALVQQSRASALWISSVDVVPRVFSGLPCRVPVLVSNTTEQLAEIQIRIRQFQVAAGSAAFVREAPWRTMRVLPGQTVLETVPLDFPPVRAQTRYLLQFWEGTNALAGLITVGAYPTNLLDELRLLADNRPIGVFDPQNQLMPALKQHGLDLLDLTTAGLDAFSGRLALIGPFESQKNISEETLPRIKDLAADGAAVIWVQPPSAPNTPPQPSFYPVTQGTGLIVVVQPEMIRDLGQSPQSQLNLLHFCRMAVRHELLQAPIPNP